MFRSTLFLVGIMVGLTVNVNAQVPATLQVQARQSTAAVQSFANDVAIWVHPTNPTQSLIIGTDLGTYPNGGIFVWNLDGSQQQRIVVSHPEQVDVEYGMQASSGAFDIVAITMRDHDELRIYKVNVQTRQLEEATTSSTIPTLASPFALGLYKRPVDGQIFAFVSGRDPETTNRVQELALYDDGTGKIAATEVRSNLSTQDLVTGIVVDDPLGYVYLAEEKAGVSKFYADPGNGNQRLAFFANSGITGGRQGLALYGCSDGTGYLLMSTPGSRAIQVYAREGENNNPNSHSLITSIKDVNGTFGKGLAATNQTLGAAFPNGALAWHDTSSNRFRLYSWVDVAQGVLDICSGSNSGTELGLITPDKLRLGTDYLRSFDFDDHTQLSNQARQKIRINAFLFPAGQVKKQLEVDLTPALERVWHCSDDLDHARRIEHLHLHISDA